MSLGDANCWILVLLIGPVLCDVRADTSFNIYDQLNKERHVVNREHASPGGPLLLRIAGGKIIPERQLLEQLCTEACHANAKCSASPTHMGYLQCECHTGYRGDGRHGCEDVDECETRCKEHALCTNNPGSYQCSCLVGFAMETDGHQVYCSDQDECLQVTDPGATGTTSHSCHPRARCVNVPGSYKCWCKPGYVGDGITTCKQNSCFIGYYGDDCRLPCSCADGRPCHRYTGQCPKEGEEVACADGYHGTSCDKYGIDECVNVTCAQGGTCLDGTEDGEFLCVCPEGYDGILCQANTSTHRTEFCVRGRYGSTCELECHCAGYHPCDKATGRCIPCDSKDYPKCLESGCESDWEGNSCQIYVTHYCTDHSCQNGATCQDLETGYRCVCAPGYSGKHCQTFSQTCPANVWGPTCEYPCGCTNYTGCDRDTGECLDGSPCLPFFTGSSCEIHGDDGCVKNHCMNGGTCVDEIDQPGVNLTYKCVCPDKYYGYSCEISPNSSQGNHNESEEINVSETSRKKRSTTESCAAGWAMIESGYNSMCLLVLPEPETYLGAHKACRNQSAELADFEDKEEFTSLLTQVYPKPLHLWVDIGVAGTNTNGWMTKYADHSAIYELMSSSKTKCLVMRAAWSEKKGSVEKINVTSYNCNERSTVICRHKQHKDEMSNNKNTNIEKQASGLDSETIIL